MLSGEADTVEYEEGTMNDEMLILIVKGVGFAVLMWFVLDREDKTMASIIASRRTAMPPPVPVQRVTPPAPVPQPPQDSRTMAQARAMAEFQRDLEEYADAVRHNRPIPERLRTDSFRIRLAIMREKLRRESQNRNPPPHSQA